LAKQKLVAEIHTIRWTDWLIQAFHSHFDDSIPICQSPWDNGVRNIVKTMASILGKSLRFGNWSTALSTLIFQSRQQDDFWGRLEGVRNANTYIPFSRINDMCSCIHNYCQHNFNWSDRSQSFVHIWYGLIFLDLW
jgi:hypothetical protein